MGARRNTDPTGLCHFLSRRVEEEGAWTVVANCRNS